MISYSIVIKRTRELLIDETNDIIRLKKQHWPYNDDEQMQWFKSNIRSDDMHILIRDGSQLIAYSNAVNVEIKVNNNQYSALGIGNVCVDKVKSDKGIGTLLMACVSILIKKKNTCGVLLCKQNLVGFYSASKWQIVHTNRASICNNPFDGIIMMLDPQNVVYSNRIDCLQLNRYF